MPPRGSAAIMMARPGAAAASLTECNRDSDRRKLRGTGPEAGTPGPPGPAGHGVAVTQSRDRAGTGPGRPGPGEGQAP